MGYAVRGRSCVVSKSAEGLAKMMTVIVTVFEAAGLAVSEKKTEAMLLRTQNQAPQTSPLVIEAAGQKYRQTMQFLYLGGLVVASADLMPEIKRRIRLAIGMLQSVQTGAVRYGGCPVHSKGAHAKGRGNGDPCGSDSSFDLWHKVSVCDDKTAKVQKLHRLSTHLPCCFDNGR